MIEGATLSTTLSLYEQTLLFPEMSVTVNEINGSSPILNTVPIGGFCMINGLGSQLSEIEMDPDKSSRV